MNILITGGFGFIGSSLANKLYDQGHKIFLVDYIDKIPEFRKIKYNEFFKVDLTSRDSLDKIKLKNIDCICHFAGQPSAALSFNNPQKDLVLNCITTLNLIDFASRNNVRRFLYASTFNVYDEINKKEVYGEEDPLNPKSPYANSKITSERNIKILCEKYSISYGILRMFNVYGPGQDPYNKSLGMINIFLNMALRSNQIEVKGSLDRFRDFIYIEDVINIWHKVLLLEENIILNVGTGTKSYVKDLLNAIIGSVSNKEIFIKQLSGTPGDFKGAIASTYRLKEVLNYQNFIPLQVGIKKYSEWVKSLI
tara:strand:- start:12854 stop:13780 length:927 start_codon:yes stop_codon:yes gene_type:complete